MYMNLKCNRQQIYTHTHIYTLMELSLSSRCRTFPAPQKDCLCLLLASTHHPKDTSDTVDDFMVLNCIEMDLYKPACV